MKRKSQILVVILILSLALFGILSGCSVKVPESTPPQTEQPKEETPVVTPGETGTKRIGMVGIALTSEAVRLSAESIKKEAEEKGWTVEMIDTDGDYAKAAAAMENLIESGVDAIVNMVIDNKQLAIPIQMANAKGIPFVSQNGVWQPGVTFDISGNEYVNMSKVTAWMADEIDRKGNIIAFVWPVLPATREREAVLDMIVEQNPEMNILYKHQVKVPGQLEDSRATMETLLQKYPNPGEISAVWAAWDEPALGASMAIEAAGRNDIIVVGIDGNEFAYDAIRDGKPFKATISTPMVAGQMVVHQLERVFGGLPPVARQIYTEGTVVNSMNVGPAGQWPITDYDWWPSPLLMGE